MENKRDVSLDIIRVFATLFVIIIHITSIGMNDMPVGSVIWKISLGVNALSRWSVPAFFMVSGSLFLNPDRIIDVKKLWKNNIFRIVFWIVVAGFMYSFLDQAIYGTLSFKSVFIAIYAIITDNTGYHLWFLYVLLMLYIATPFLRFITCKATKKQLVALLVIWFLISICFGRINCFAKEFFGIETLLPYESYPVSGYCGYYFLGEYLRRYGKSRIYSLIILCGCICIAVSPFLNIYVADRFGKRYCETLLSPLSISSCIIASFVFIVFKKIRSLNIKVEKIVVFLSMNSFGVYLIHVFWISLLFRILNVNFVCFGNVLSILIWTVIITVLSLITSFIMRKIPGLKKML